MPVENRPLILENAVVWPGQSRRRAPESKAAATGARLRLCPGHTTECKMPISSALGDAIKAGAIMNRRLLASIAAAIAHAQMASENPGSHAFLPEIIESLETMRRQGAEMSPRERGRLAGALGRLVTEDYAFSESTLGTMLLGVADQFALDEG